MKHLMKFNESQSITNNTDGDFSDTINIDGVGYEISDVDGEILPEDSMNGNLVLIKNGKPYLLHKM